MKTILHLGDNPITLNFKSFEKEVDVDNLLKIDYSNIFAEKITASALYNQIGLLKAEIEQNHSKKKFECEIYESTRRKEIRSEYMKNEAKLTEKQLDEEIILDKPFQVKKQAVFTSKKNLDFIEAIYWAVKEKVNIVKTLSSDITPEDFANELVEMEINNIVIKGSKSLLKKQTSKK